MRAVFLAAGAGGMYCGSCLRDNRLAATLIARGRDVSLIPLYTPIRTDESDASQPTVHFGGVGVFLKHKYRWAHHIPAQVYSWFNHPVIMRALGSLASKTRPEELGGLTVAMLKGRAGPLSQELDQLLATLKQSRPTFIVLPNLMFIGIAEDLKRALGARVLCTLSGEDIFLDQLPDPFRGECFRLIEAAAKSIDGFVAVTRYYGEHATQHFRLDASRMHYVPLGVHIPSLEVSTQRDTESVPVVGYLARICQEKGLAVLCKAFAELHRRGVRCRLRIGGYRSAADRQYLSDCHAFLEGQGLKNDFEDCGELDATGKKEFLRSLDVLSVPTVYPEAKGVYVLEALAHGVPVVQPAHGSFPELIDDTGGGLLTSPGDVSALADAIQNLLRDGEQRRRLGEAGRAGVERKYSADRMADEMWRLLETLGR